MPFHVLRLVLLHVRVSTNVLKLQQERKISINLTIALVKCELLVNHVLMTVHEASVLKTLIVCIMMLLAPDLQKYQFFILSGISNTGTLHHTSNSKYFRAITCAKTSVRTIWRSCTIFFRAWTDTRLKNIYFKSYLYCMRITCLAKDF